MSEIQERILAALDHPRFGGSASFLTLWEWLGRPDGMEAAMQDLIARELITDCWRMVKGADGWMRVTEYCHQ